MTGSGSPPVEESLRTIAHIGAPIADRFHFVRTGLRRIRTALPAGKSVAASVADLMQEQGCTSGIVELSGGRLDPFHFVIPANDPQDKYPVWYSDTRVCPGGATFERATCSVGLSKGAPMLHCHGLWRDGSGALLGGHLLPDDNLIVEPVEVHAVLATDARFERQMNAETQFEVFAVAGGGAGRGVLATLQPNGDISEAIESLALAAGVRNASVHGIGSLIDMSLIDGQVARSIALEVAIVGGRIVPHGSGVAVVDLAMAGAGMDGIPYEGMLRYGRNNVCVTFELALDVED